MTDVSAASPESAMAAGTEVEPDDLPEQVRVRLGKREELLAAGIEPYPVSVPTTATLAQLREKYGDLAIDVVTGDFVDVAGRVIFLRNTGKLCFAKLRAGDGTEIQLMLSLDRVGADSLDRWKHYIDIGDIVSVHGEVGTSRRGELSVFVGNWALATKSLRPLPVAHKPMSEQTRVRQRYVDLIVRPEARLMARQRIEAVASLRRSFATRDFLEVETPMLQTLHGGAAARPFVTHINAYDIDLYLRIAPELFLKRCVVGGLERVFEINRNFRNEGADSTHSPEFAMLEFYQAYADYNDMADLTRALIQEAALAVHGSLQFEHYDGSSRDLSGDWTSVSMYPAVSDAIGLQVDPETSIGQLQPFARSAGIQPLPTWTAGHFIEALFEHHVAPGFVGPTFVRDFPVDTSPLVRAHRSLPGVVEKWDLYIDGYEQATGYSELVDPVVQRERLEQQAQRGAVGDREAMALDEDFLRALEHGMPPSGGVGLGIDRLLMSLTGLGIRETVLFPLVKPE